MQKTTAVPCPVCRAPAMRSCVNGRGDAVNPHTLRVASDKPRFRVTVALVIEVYARDEAEAEKFCRETARRVVLNTRMPLGAAFVHTSEIGEASIV